MKTYQQLPGRALFLAVLPCLLFLFYTCTPDPAEKLAEEQAALSAKSTDEASEMDLQMRTLVEGAALKTANGVDIGPDDNLYIASVLGQEILVMDRRTGYILDRLGADKGVAAPDDLVFGPDGSLYWTDILTGEVGRLSPDGEVTKQFVALGVNPITFSPEGRLFVALDFLGDGLYELDPDLMDPPRQIISATPENPFPLGFFNSFDFGEDGRLYGPLFAAGLIISVDVGNPGDPVSTDPFADGTAQVVASGFSIPAAAKFNSQGTLFVLDQTGEIFQVDVSTGTKTLFTTLEPGLDNLTFSEDGSIYITNNDEGSVHWLLPNGDARKISRGGLIAPQGLALYQGPSDEREALYVADQFTLRKFDLISGQELALFRGLLVPAEDGLSLILPMGLSTDGELLIITSWFSGAVQTWDPETMQVLEHFAMGAPIDAVRFMEELIVSDVGLGGVAWARDNAVVLPADGANLIVPSGLEAAGNTLYIADWATGNILRVIFDGKTPGSPEVVASGLQNPEGIALDGTGGLLVVETGAAKLSRIDLESGEVTTIAQDLQLSGPGLEGYPPTWTFEDVTVGKGGAIYVSQGGNNTVKRFTAIKPPKREE